MYGKTRAGVGLPALVDSDGVLLTPAGRYADAALNGRLFCVSNQAAVSTTAALATTWTGLGVANPTGSGKLLIMHRFSFAATIVGSDDGAIGLMTATDTGFAAAIAARCCRNGYATSVAYCDDGATISTPVLELVVGTHGMGATTTQITAGPNIVDLGGSIVLAPGRSVLTYTTTATTTCLAFSFMWEEISI